MGSDCYSFVLSCSLIGMRISRAATLSCLLCMLCFDVAEKRMTSDLSKFRNETINVCIGTNLMIIKTHKVSDGIIL